MSFLHEDKYLEQQQKKNIETEVRGVDKIKITKVYAKNYACCPGWPSGGSYNYASQT
jgi:hypothetical protein